jgi:3-hydroxyisobutyrate dehydrogenase-like beta-hydroxyacid dehydrogenase
MRVGFVGLGNAGRPMAGQLIAAGNELVVRDRDAQRTAAFAAEHGARPGEIPERFADVEVLFTMLPHGGVVREVLLGSEGIAPHLAPGTAVVDTSSADPIATRALAGELEPLGIGLLDAAVSEARVGDAKRGAITFMVGADDEAAFRRVRPLLEAMSAHIFRVGPTGSGQAMKTLNNYISAAGLHAALDSLIAGQLYGLDLAMMLDAFNVSTARNLSTEGTMKHKALPRTFERRYSLGLLAKDMGIARALARHTGFETELFGVLERAFAAARDDVGYDDDLTASLLHWERQAGVELPAIEPSEQLREVPRAPTGAGGARTIGFVGLRDHGAPLAAHLVAAGHRLLVDDADLESARGFAAFRGCRAVERGGELADAELVFAVLPDAEAIRGALLGDRRIAEHLAAGTIVVAAGSSSPSATRRLADELGERGLRLVDAAISVPHIGAIAEGRINFFLGCDDERALAEVVSVLGTMSEHIFNAGRAGAGHALGTLNDYIAAAGLRGALDGLIVGWRYGLDPAAMLDVLNLSTGRNFSTEQTLRVCSLPRRFDSGYRIGQLVDDLDAALRFARELGIGAELFELVHADFAAALDDLGDDDVSALLRHWEHMAGAQLPRSPAPAEPARR